MLIALIVTGKVPGALHTTVTVAIPVVPGPAGSARQTGAIDEMTPEGPLTVKHSVKGTQPVFVTTMVAVPVLPTGTLRVLGVIEIDEPGTHIEVVTATGVIF